jgi:hypothetical protein
MIDDAFARFIEQESAIGFLSYDLPGTEAAEHLNEHRLIGAEDLRQDGPRPFGR